MAAPASFPPNRVQKPPSKAMRQQPQRSAREGANSNSHFKNFNFLHLQHYNFITRTSSSCYTVGCIVSRSMTTSLSTDPARRTATGLAPNLNRLHHVTYLSPPADSYRHMSIDIEASSQLFHLEDTLICHRESLSLKKKYGIFSNVKPEHARGAVYWAKVVPSARHDLVFPTLYCIAGVPRRP